MTREEALQHFKEQLDIFGGEHAEAIKVAIEALSEETPTIQEKHQLSEETSTNTSTKSTNISTDTSADRPRGEQYKKGFEDAKRAFLVEYARESENMRKRIAQLEVMLNAQKAILADRPRGEWKHSPNGIDRDFVWWVCSECGHKIFSETEKDRREFHAYCGRCGADMRSE